MDLYAENILDHYRSPRHKASLERPTVAHEERNHSCGDSVLVELKIDEGKLTEIGWKGEGCAISQAGMSMLSEELSGKTVEETEKIDAAAMLALLGVPVGPRRMKCALLGLHALKNALRQAEGEEAQGWGETVGER